MDGNDISNQVLDVIDARSSTRAFAGQATGEQRAAVINAALRAPTAGNMTLYSIIEVVDPSQRERVTKLCYDQRFMMDASMMLVFVCDYERNLDLFDYLGRGECADTARPGYGGVHACGAGCDVRGGERGYRRRGGGSRFLLYRQRARP